MSTRGPEIPYSCTLLLHPILPAAPPGLARPGQIRSLVKKKKKKNGLNEWFPFVRTSSWLCDSGLWHWNRQKWGRKRQAKVAGLQKHGTLLCLSQILLASDPSTIEVSNFQIAKKTRFIIHGFIDKGDESWLVDKCKVGPGSNP